MAKAKKCPYCNGTKKESYNLNERVVMTRPCSHCTKPKKK